MISELPIKQHIQLKSDRADLLLSRVIRILFTVGVIGMWIFSFYILAFYGGAVADGAYERINDQLPHGVIEGDPMGNAMLAMHISLAVIITLGGPIQFFSSIRNRFPRFHRWNGRIYYLTAFLVTFAGFYMIIMRGSHSGVIGFLGNLLNGILIVGFSILSKSTKSRFSRNSSK